MHTILNAMTLLLAKKYQNWLISVEDVASQSSVIFKTVYGMTEKTQFLGLMFPYVVHRYQLRRGGITNHHLIAYSLSNISAKNYQNQLCVLSYSVQCQCHLHYKLTYCNSNKLCKPSTCYQICNKRA